MRPSGPAALLLLAALALPLHPSTAAAQVPADPVLRGRVLVGDSGTAAGWVVLHRVSEAAQGEVDSVRVGQGGAFQLRLPAVPLPDGSEVYFASLRHHGILYFGRAVSLPVHLDSLYTIQAYDTAAAPPGGASFVVESRSLFVEEVEAGRWQVTDLLQVRNAGDRTLVSGPGSSVWSHPLPAGAEGGDVTQVDMAAPAGEVREGQVHITAPFPPGERLFVVRYGLASPFTSVPVRPGTANLEVLVREPAPPMDMSGLAQAAPVALDEGAVFRRYIASEAPPETVTIARGSERSEPPVRGMAVLLALVLAGVAAWTLQARFGPLPRRVPSGPPPDRRALILEVAQLDEAFSALADPTPEERGAYEARRGELLRRLTHLG